MYRLPFMPQAIPSDLRKFKISDNCMYMVVAIVRINWKML